MTTMTPETGTRMIRAQSHASSSRLRPSSRHATLTIGGVVYVVMTLFLAVGAVNAQNNLLFWVFGVSISILITSGVLSGNALMGVRIRSGKIGDARAGEPHRIRYELYSSSRFFPLFGLLVRERLKKSESFELIHPAVVVHLAPRKTTGCTAQLAVHTRGIHTLDSFGIESSFPFGIIKKWIRFDQPRSFLALPYRLELKASLLNENASSWSDDADSRPRRGAGGDYFGLREYVHGDSRREIAWKQSARRGELVVVEQAEQTTHRVMIWLSEPDTLDSPELIERAIALVCAVARQAIESPMAVGVWVPWAGVRLHPESGQAQLAQIERAMAMLDLDAHRHEDGPPGAHLGSVVEVHSGHAHSGGRALLLNASEPGSWIAPGAALPAALDDAGHRP